MDNSGTFVLNYMYLNLYHTNLHELEQVYKMFYNRPLPSDVNCITLYYTRVLRSFM